ncbi:MAG: phenylalanine--tRNA ligase subunit alpha [Patescibacteria group bacterium]|nr:phenylalanine--tRNA ligase subunit alpha [Patescibacteria group bacterium]
MSLQDIKNQAKEAAEKIGDLADWDDAYRRFLGKKGEIAKVFMSIKTMAEAEKRALGKEANEVKNEIERFLAERKAALQKEFFDVKPQTETIDITRPGEKPEFGRLHPLTLAQRDIINIFHSMGFGVADGPEMETEWYNFDALNMPKDHPARDMQDTFWLRQNELKVKNEQVPPAGKQKLKIKSERLLLRTQTSAVQVRYMETHRPPLRIIVPGRIFRNEATDATHESQFYQTEGLMAGKNISAANFKAILQKFLSLFFNGKTEIRLRPSYFPFTEPSFEIDAKGADGKWLELMGAGMVNQKVFQAAGYPLNKYTGFAFGVGVDRLAMIKYNIKEIRLFYQNDLRFLKQF